MINQEKKNMVNPWEVNGNIDYDKLIKEFGVSKLDYNLKRELEEISKKKGKELHLYLRRDLFFSHRELDKVLKDIKLGKKIFLYTGRAPGGSMHIGHLVPFLFTKYLQDIFDCNLYIQIPDDEKFLFKKDLTLQKIDEMVKSDLTDIAAIGFNPDKTFIFRNSEYISKMFPLYLRTAKKITFSIAKAVFGFTNESNIGMISYPTLQIVPTFFEKNRVLIPCAIDQDPYFRIQRDIAESLGYKKNAIIHAKFIPPLTGVEGKMSASDSSKAILLTDDEKTVKKKINKCAFSGGQPTIEEHKKYGGRTDIDVSYIWLYYLFEEDDKKIEEIRDSYESGKLLSGELKAILIDKINSFLRKHRESKEKVLKEGLLEKYMYEGKLAKEMWNKNFR